VSDEALCQLFLRDFAASWAHIIKRVANDTETRTNSPLALQEAAIKAEINEAKNALDLMRMAYAIARLDALNAEMEAASRSDDGHRY
jgi:hypothetical protein